MTAITSTVRERLPGLLDRGGSDRETFEYRCTDCGTEFEATEASPDKAFCSACSSEAVDRVVGYQRTWWGRRSRTVRWLLVVGLAEVVLLGLGLFLDVAAGSDPRAAGGAHMIAGLLGALAVLVALGSMVTGITYGGYVALYGQ